MNKIVRRNNRNNSRKTNAFPPSFSSQPMSQRKFRFASTATLTNVDIQRKDMLSLLLAISTAGTSSVATGVFSAVKLDRIMIWGVPDSSVSVCNININFPGNNSPDTRISDTGNPMYPAHISVVPPKSSFAELWTNTSSTQSEVLFEVQGSSNTEVIIDIQVTVVISDGVANNYNLASAVGPGILAAYLDAHLNGSALIQPVSLNYSLLA